MYRDIPAHQNIFKLFKNVQDKGVEINDLRGKGFVLFKTRYLQQVAHHFVEPVQGVELFFDDASSIFRQFFLEDFFMTKHEHRQGGLQLMGGTADVFFLPVE